VDRDVAVPDLLGVYDNRHTVLALIETSRVVGADDLGQATRCELGLEAVTDIDAALRLAAPLGGVGRALVDTHKHMTLKARHPRNTVACSPTAQGLKQPGS